MRLPIAFLLLLCSAPVLAQTRPLRTEEATTLAAGSIRLETGFDYITDEPNFTTQAERDFYAGPALALTYAPGDRAEFDIEWVVRVGAIDDPDFGSASDWGDVTLRGKVRFTDSDPAKPAIGARFSINLPETSYGEGLGTNTLRMTAEMLGTFHVGSGRIHANAGIALLDDPSRAHAQNDFFSFGLAFEQPLGARWTALAEAAGLAGSQGSPGADARSEARAGAAWGTSRWRFDFALRHGLSPSAGNWGATTGFTYLIRPRS